jgi:hypothetical protein
MSLLRLSSDIYYNISRTLDNLDESTVYGMYVVLICFVGKSYQILFEESTGSLFVESTGSLFVESTGSLSEEWSRSLFLVLKVLLKFVIL